FRRAEELRAPVEGLEAGEREEAAEGVVRAVVGGGAVGVVGKWVAVAERAAGEDERPVAVEGREEPLDVVLGAERGGARVAVGRDDAIDERPQRRALVAGEEAAARRRPRPLDVREREHGRRGEHAERLQELAPAEQQDDRGRLRTGRRRWRRGRGESRGEEPRRDPRVAGQLELPHRRAL